MLQFDDQRKFGAAWPWLEGLSSDLRFALRALGRNPGFTAVTLLTLALGMGANTAIFSVVNAVLLRTLPVRSPRELVRIQVLDGRGEPRGAFSYPFYLDLRDRGQVLAGLIGRFPLSATLSDGPASEHVEGELVTGNYFEVLGVRAAAGRLITPDDDRLRLAHPVCVLGHGYWLRRFGGDPNAVGRTVRLNGRAYTVIGVSEASFTASEPGYTPDLRVPMMMQPDFMRFELFNRRSSWLQMIGRLKPGVSLPQAQAALQVTLDQIAREREEARRDGGRMVLRSGSQGLGFLRGRLERPLLALMGAVGLLLLIACSNIAGLLTARASGRGKEMAVRAALGAGRGGLARLLLAESLLLALGGGALGALAARWMVDGLLSFAAGMFPPRLAINAAPDWRVFGFTLAVSLLAGLLFGLAPARESLRLDLASSLKEAPAGARGRLRTRRLLVVLQTALSVVLLAGAGLLIGTLWNLRTLDPGFRPGNLILLSMSPRQSGYTAEAASAFWDRVTERVAALPGVESASVASIALLSGAMSSSDFTPEGYRPRRGEEMTAYTNVVGPGYFATLGIPVQSGREFTARDRRGTPPVVVVNEALARHYWRGENPVGKRIIWGTADRPEFAIEVVGLVRDARYQSLRRETPPIIYSPAAQSAAENFTLHVRSSSGTPAALAAIQAAVRAVDGNVPVYEARTMAAQMDRSLAAERLLAVLCGAFGSAALLLALVGLYGVVACAVGERRREIGIRMALGADRLAVAGLVMREGAVLIAAGLAAGLPAAWAASRLLAGFLYGLRSNDLRTYLAVTALLAAAGLAACWLPARRAARLEAAALLRHQ